MSDLLMLGRTTIEEARSLLYWLEVAEGYKKLGICGLSMGMSSGPNYYTNDAISLPTRSQRYSLHVLIAGEMIPCPTKLVWVTPS